LLGEIYRWISRAGLLCLAVGGFVPLAAPPKNRPISNTSIIVFQLFPFTSRCTKRTKRRFISSAATDDILTSAGPENAHKDVKDPRMYKRARKLVERVAKIRKRKEL
jgi:hypothetical protein